MNRHLIKKVGSYIVLGGFAFVCGLYLTFPGDAVGQRMSYELRKKTGGALSASFGSVSPYGLTGIEATDVTLTWTRHMGDPVTLQLENMRARLQILPLFVFAPAVSIGLDLGHGTVEAYVTSKKNGYAVDATIKDVDLASPPLLSQIVNMPIAGIVGGNFDLIWVDQAQGKPDMRKSSGHVAISLKRAALGPGEPMPGMTLPASIGLGQIDLNVTLKNGRAQVTQFRQIRNKDPIDLEIKRATAATNFKPVLYSSTYDACFEVKLSDQVMQKHPKLQSITMFATAFVQKDSDNFLHVPVAGTFSSKPRTRRRLCKAK